MKKATMIIAAAVIAVATAARAYALDMVASPVPGSGATCTTSVPAEPAMGKAQTISVSAKVLSTVSVKLSATKIDWKVTSAGTYKYPSINIYVSNQNGHDVAMNVAGAADLANGGGRKINTYYGIAANWRTIVYDLNAGRGAANALSEVCPIAVEPQYQRAVDFNGSHKLSSGSMSTLWNKIVVDDQTPTGDYADQFTVTFSEQL